MDFGRRWSWLPREDGRPPSTFQLFNAIIAVRWVSLAIVSAGYILNLRTRELDYGLFVPALTVALAYLTLLSMFTDRAFRLRMEGPFLLVADYLVSFIILTLSSGVWTPLFIFVLCTAMMAGLRGRWSSGVAGAVVLSVLYCVALPLKGLTLPDLVATDSVALVIVYNLEIMIFSVVWAYAAGLVVRFNKAVAEATEARDAVATANEHLERHRGELYAIHAIRDATLNLVDLDDILPVVLDAVRAAGFAEPRIHLADEGVPPVTAADAATPIRAASEALGTLVVRSPDGGLSQEEAQLLELFADQVALAIQHVRLFERGREHAVAGERNRIAIEIHDAVLQKIYGASLLAQSMSPDRFVPGAGEDLQTLKDAITASLRDLRMVVLNWDSLGWDLPLLEAADRYLEEFGEISDLRVRLATYGAARDAEAAKRKDLLAILQEALSNAWRHAKAESVTVALAFESGNVSLSVRDDGHGFDASVGDDQRGGLQTIHERAQRHDGHVFLASAPGQGTQVRIEMPW